MDDSHLVTQYVFLSSYNMLPEPDALLNHFFPYCQRHLIEYMYNTQGSLSLSSVACSNTFHQVLSVISYPEWVFPFWMNKDILFSPELIDPWLQIYFPELPDKINHSYTWLPGNSSRFLLLHLSRSHLFAYMSFAFGRREPSCLIHF